MCLLAVGPARPVLVLLQQRNPSRSPADTAPVDAEIRDNGNCHVFWHSLSLLRDIAQPFQMILTDVTSTVPVCPHLS